MPVNAPRLCTALAMNAMTSDASITFWPGNSQASEATSVPAVSTSNNASGQWALGETGQCNHSRAQANANAGRNSANSTRRTFGARFEKGLLCGVIWYGVTRFIRWKATVSAPLGASGKVRRARPASPTPTFRSLHGKLPRPPCRASGP